MHLPRHAIVLTSSSGLARPSSGSPGPPDCGLEFREKRLKLIDDNFHFVLVFGHVEGHCHFTEQSKHNVVKHNHELARRGNRDTSTRLGVWTQFNTPLKLYKLLKRQLWLWASRQFVFWLYPACISSEMRSYRGWRKGEADAERASQYGLPMGGTTKNRAKYWPNIFRNTIPLLLAKT